MAASLHNTNAERCQIDPADSPSPLDLQNLCYNVPLYSDRALLDANLRHLTTSTVSSIWKILSHDFSTRCIPA